MTTTSPGTINEALTWWHCENLNSTDAADYFGGVYEMRSNLARYVLTGERAVPLPENWSYDVLVSLYLANEYILAWSNMQRQR